MTPYFVHGWGFDASLWSALSALLGGVAIDRGYFGTVSTRIPEGPVLAIGHSLGALLLLRDPPPGTRAIVAINGFDRFTGGEDWPGVPRRIVDRMLDRVPDAPDRVLADFHARCGTAAPSGAPDPVRLEEDLRLLRDADERCASARLRCPLLVLQGEADPILPAGLRARTFGSAHAVARATCEGGGHVLPLSHAGWCAERITAFADRLR